MQEISLAMLTVYAGLTLEYYVDELKGDVTFSPDLKRMTIEKMQY
jgi:hypothetical protein